jgi:hypothetical protein
MGWLHDIPCKFEDFSIMLVFKIKFHWKEVIKFSQFPSYIFQIVYLVEVLFFMTVKVVMT